MKESEIDFVRSRLGIAGVKDNIITKWIGGQSLNDIERNSILNATLNIARTSRENLTTLENAHADLLAKKYSIPVEQVQPLIDSNHIYQAPGGTAGTRALNKQKDLKGQGQGASAAPAKNRLNEKDENSVMDSIIDSVFGG